MSIENEVEIFDQQINNHENKILKLSILKSEVKIIDEIIKLCNYCYLKCQNLLEEDIVYTDFVDYKLNYLSGYMNTSNFLATLDDFINIHLCYNLKNHLINIDTQKYLNIIKNYLSMINNALKKYNIIIMYEELKNNDEMDSKIFLTINYSKVNKKKKINSRNIVKKLKINS